MNPIFGIFPGPCAWAGRQSPKSMAQSAQTTSFGFVLLPKARPELRRRACCLMPFVIESVDSRARARGLESSDDLFCRLQVDHELKFRRLLHRQIGRLGVACHNVVRKYAARR